MINCGGTFSNIDYNQGNQPYNKLMRTEQWTDTLHHHMPAATSVSDKTTKASGVPGQ